MKKELDVQHIMKIKLHKWGAILYALIILSSITLAQDYNCSMVIGFSQVGSPNGGWYVAGSGSVSDFEQITGDANWQLLWKSGGGVDE